MVWEKIEVALKYKVTCEACNAEDCFRTLDGAKLAADNHEITHPDHFCEVWGATEDKEKED